MDKIEENRNISVKLKELRRARGLTVDNLAKKMGENSQKVGRIERGARSITFDYLVKVSKALETPVESFLEEDKRGEVREFSTSDSNILNNIVIQVENSCKKFPIKADKKAKIISKIYELSLKFPEEHKKQFINSLIEFMNCLDI